MVVTVSAGGGFQVPHPPTLVDRSASELMYVRRGEATAAPPPPPPPPPRIGHYNHQHAALTCDRPIGATGVQDVQGTVPRGVGDSVPRVQQCRAGGGFDEHQLPHHSFNDTARNAQQCGLAKRVRIMPCFIIIIIIIIVIKYALISVTLNM